MVAVAMVNALFAAVYFINKDDFDGINTYLDALIYSMNVNSSLNDGTIKPSTKKGKIMTMVHNVLVFVSVANFLITPNPKNILIFIVINAVISSGFGAGYYFLDKKSKPVIDYASHSISTHTSFGIGSMKQLNKNVKMLTLGHMLLIFSLMYTFSRNGLFHSLSKPLFGHVY